MAPDPHEIRDEPVRELLGRYAAILGELYRRGVVRSRIAPAGDLAELLVARALGGTVVTGNRRSWDVLAGGRRLQVTCRVVRPETRPSSSYAAFRGWDADGCVFVQFDHRYGVRQAVDVPLPALRRMARAAAGDDPGEPAGHRIRLGDDLTAIPGAIERTAQVRAALAGLDRECGGGEPDQPVLPFEAVEALVVPRPADVAATGWCFCGCGTSVPEGRFFAPAHDRMAEAGVVAEWYGSIAGFVAAHRPQAGSPPGVTDDAPHPG